MFSCCIIRLDRFATSIHWTDCGEFVPAMISGMYVIG
jgi:hypothetical protein